MRARGLASIAICTSIQSETVGGQYCVMMVEANHVLVLCILLVSVAISDQSDPDVQYRKDLKQINYYNWLLHRHRTEMQKIEKTNSDIKNVRLQKLQEILDTPAPHNVSLITTSENFEKIRRMVRPVSNKPVTESIEQLTALLVPQRRQAKKGQKDTTEKPEKPEEIVEFQLSERDYQKFSKFLNNKTVRKEVAQRVA